MSFDRWPFASNDAVTAGIPERTVSHDQVIPEDPVEFSSKSLDRPTTLLVEEVGTEFDGNTIQFLESMLQQHQLAFGVKGPSLDSLSTPS